MEGLGMHEITQRAIDAVGHNAPGNRSVEFEQHIERLPDEAGALKRVLAADAIQDIVRAYRTYNEVAGPAQKKELRWATLLIWFPMILVMLASAYACISSINLIRPRTEMWLAVGLLIVYVYMTTRHYIVEVGNFQSKWLAHREKAEYARRAYFERMLEINEEVRSGEIPLLPLKLEVFRRYQLEVQQTFYNTRGPELEMQATREERWWLAGRIIADFAVVVTVAMLGLTAVAPMSEQGPMPGLLQSATGHFLGHAERSYAVAFAALVVIATALGTALRAQVGVNRKKSNASRYQAALQALNELEKFGLHHAREAALSNNIAEVRNFVAAAHRIMIGEQAIFFERSL
jgi:hypothetical protein